MRIGKSMMNDKFKIMVDSENLNNLDKIHEDFIEVGKIRNSTIRKDVLYVVYDKNRKEKTNHMMFASLRKDGEENECCVVFIRDEYIKRFKDDINHLLFSLFHELGHFINEDFSNPDFTDNQLRMEYIKNGKVLPCELNADEFALKQLLQSKIPEDFIINEFDYMIQGREKISGWDHNAQFAIKELELRKNHIVQLLKNKKV